MLVYQLCGEKNGERFLKSAHRFGENAQRFSAATAVLLVCAAVSHAGVAVFAAVSHAGVAVLLVAGAGGGSVKAK